MRKIFDVLRRSRMPFEMHSRKSLGKRQKNDSGLSERLAWGFKGIRKSRLEGDNDLTPV